MRRRKVELGSEGKFTIIPPTLNILDADPVATRALHPQTQVELVVFDSDEAGFAVIAALNNMVWKVG